MGVRAVAVNKEKQHDVRVYFGLRDHRLLDVAVVQRPTS